jgi:outer membrane protein assembly factor BamD
MVLAVGNRPVQALRLLGIGAVAVLLAGCSTASVIKDVFGNDSTPAATTSMGLTGGAMSPGSDAPARGDPVAELYNAGLEKLKAGSYKSAAKSFAEVERQHPYSKWATKALLMQAFANYQSNKYDDAINAANRFITLHPGHKDSAYAYYLTAISQYEQISDVRRDQSRTQKALEALEEVGKRFPQSPYAADAMKKAAMARDHLAAKEMEVGRYYLKKGSYLAGINRFKKVVTDYQTTTQVPEALYRLTEGYMALGVVSEAQTAAAVLGQNFPNSQWYKDAYTLVSSDGQQPVENKKSWISRIFSS